MIEYIIFGVIDNAVMLSGALFGVSIEKKFPEKLQSGFLGATIGAGLGNAFSDFLGGLGAANLSLAFGSAIPGNTAKTEEFSPVDGTQTVDDA